MTTLRRTIIIAALAAVVGTWIFEFHQNSQLREQLQTFQQQQTFLTQQLGKLKVAHQKTELQVAALQSSRQMVHTNASITPLASSVMDSNPIPSSLVEAELERAFSESTWGGREATFERLGKNIAVADIPRSLVFLVQRPGINGLETPLFDNLASRWGEADHNAAIAWADSLQDTNAQERAMTKILLGWSKQHREEAATFAAEIPTGNLRDAAVKQVIGDWSFWDARGASQWLAQNPQFAEDALGGLIFWGQGSCPAAIADLLDQQYSLGHTNWLQQHGEQVASIWLSRDSDAARAWIEQAPLTDDVKQRLLSGNH